MKLTNVFLWVALFLLLKPKKKTMISKNFSLEEMTFSPTAKKIGIANEPGVTETAFLYMLVLHVLQPLRDFIGPVTVTSGYRSPELNAALNGAPNSQHVNGMAADIKTSDNAHAFRYIYENLPFDQLIWEEGTDQAPAWIHVSYAGKDKNRGQVLRYKNGVYSNFVI